LYIDKDGEEAYAALRKAGKADMAKLERQFYVF
jgi:hypothetical protein